MESKTTFKETVESSLPIGWKKKTIGEICSIRRGASPRPIHDFLDTCGIPWVKISDATAQKTRYIEWTKQYIKEKGKDRTVIVEPNDLILSNSATPGIPKFMKIVAGIHDGWLLLRDFNGVENTFLYYLLINERQNLIGIADGTVFKNLNIEIIFSHEIILPTLFEQEKIVVILSNMDSKIENLQNQNKILEQILQKIFKSWFIDFDGKIEFVDSDLGKIPKGWEVSMIGKELKVLTGGTPSRNKKEYWENGTIPWIGSKKINELRIIQADEFISNEGKQNSSTQKIPKRTTVLAIIGATIGKVSLVEIDCCINQNIAAILGNEKFSSEYIYPWIKNMIDEIVSWKSGGAQSSLNQNSIKKTLLLIPDKKTMQNYLSLVKPLYEQTCLNFFEINRLIKLRDSLIPKLMSGEIIV